MAVTKLDTGRVIFQKAKYVQITPYTDEDTIGETTYDVTSIVADTLSITPDDNTINSKEWEFGDVPLFENVTLGKFQLAMTCIDMQNAIMTSIYGWEEDATSKSVFAPSSYVDKWAKIEIAFHGTQPNVVIPKAKLNSKATLGTLKTGSGEAQIAGTAYPQKVKVGSITKETTLAFVPQDQTYQVGSEIV